MARMARQRSNSGIYHVMFRGINRQNIFEDDEDRYKFLEILGYFKRLGKYRIYGYCLMNNHIHILIKEMEDTVSEAIKRISSTYVRWYNSKYERCGHLFQERFKSEAVENEGYLLTVLRYIHQNPIKAGIIEELNQYKWSSYYEYISVPIIVDIDIVLEIISMDRPNALEIFEEYMNEDNKDKCLGFTDNKLSDEELILYIKSLGVDSISDFQQLDTPSRNKIIRNIKSLENIPIRQIARVTGISKSVIGRVI